MFVRSLLCLLAVTVPYLAGAEHLGQAQESRPDFRIDSPKGLVKMPFELYWDGILLKARINGSQPVLLALDTGAGPNVINGRLFASLGLKAEGASTLAGGGGNAQGQFLRDATISLPGLEAYKQIIFSAPMDPLATMGRDVEGLLGTAFLKNFVVEIDYANQVVTFYDPKVHNLSKEPDTLPLKGRNGNPYIPAELSINGRDKVSAEFMVDTGSNRIFHVSKPFADTHQLLSLVPKSKTTVGLGEAIGGRTTFTEVRIASIKIGKWTIQNPVVSIAQNTQGLQSESGETGIIGAELLRRFTLTMDYSSDRVLLKPNASFAEPYEIDMSGLELQTKLDDSHAFMITGVVPQYPAAEAGLREGDQITAVDGRPAAELDLAQIVEMFKEPGKTHLLTVQRRNENLKVALKLRRVI